MQQTSKYQFNLIEPEDKFLPTPLNQNMEKVEEAFQEIQTDLGTIGHNLRVETGSYVGTGTCGSANPSRLTFSLTPVLVMIALTSSTVASPPMILMRSVPCSIFLAGANASYGVFVTWEDHAVQWYTGANSDYYQGNSSGGTYSYIALGY